MKKLFAMGFVFLVCWYSPAKAENITVPDGIEAYVIFLYESSNSVDFVLAFEPAYTMPESMPSLTLEYGEKDTTKTKVELVIANDMTNDEQFVTVPVTLSKLKPGTTYQAIITMQFKSVEYTYIYDFRTESEL